MLSPKLSKLCLNRGFRLGLIALAISMSFADAQAQDEGSTRYRRVASSAARAGSSSAQYSEDQMEYSGPIASSRPTTTVRQASMQEAPQNYRPRPSMINENARAANQASMEEPVGVHGPDGMYAGPGCGDTCGGGGCGSGCGDCGDCMACGPTQCCIGETYFYEPGFFLGADYLYLRPHFGATAAAIERTTVVDGNNSATITDTLVSYDPDYQSNYRVFGGYRWGECGEALTFTYWNVNGDGNYESGVVPSDLSVIYSGAMGNNAQLAGEQLFSSFSMDLNVYDLDYSKRIMLGDDCCPTWDVMWSAGVRVADFTRTNYNSVTTPGAAITSISNAEASFVGAGPRIGGELRRYFGDCRKLSVYARGFQSLLLGDYDNDAYISELGSVVLTTASSRSANEVIPVTEIEVGVSRQFGCRSLLSAGYQMQVWWDIGRFPNPETDGCNCGGAGSNNLSFDGLFVRYEHTFGGWCRPACDTGCP
ncbi:MAG: Lpg1974 family pore-forming outer membrane protein [Planctomycetota bacterium]|nr:Lpg1974 family pore-forming outer membrane protein [Planctomycetota bacterium]